MDALLALLEPESQEAVEPPTRDQVREALGRLAEDYAGRGIELREVASGFRIQVRPEYARRLGRLWAERPARYSRALLETLALVAYRQPISRAEIEEVRGVSVSSSIFKTLQDREWVRVVGHRDSPGRPALYGTTRQFLDDFNLKQLSDLPPLSELQDPERMTGDLFEALVAGAAAPADAEEGAAEEPPAAGAPEAGSGPGSGTGTESASGSEVGGETRPASEPGGGS
jgi:segregation and condensation protein B